MIRITFNLQLKIDAAPNSILRIGGSPGPGRVHRSLFGCIQCEQPRWRQTELHQIKRAEDISDSFAHAETTTPIPVSYSYNESAMMAAALGITVVSAAGDSAQVDVPSNALYVTAVGGTNVELKADKPGNQSRAGASRAADCGASSRCRRGSRTPVFAATLALVNQSRKAQGKPSVRFLNPLLYKNTATRAAFRDITQVGYGGCATSSGYDLPTGVGTPIAPQRATAVP